ncbi:MAG: head decoration protein [Butyrivibrio sp.]|nr:head decoration protein [Butyrivibrio sp.]
MSKSLFNTIGEHTPDNLIADCAFPKTAKGIKIAKGEGVLPRGALLGKAEDGTYKLAGKETVEADCILTDPVNAEDEDVIAAAYVSGTFNRAAITVAEGASVDNYETELRKLGIYLKSVQE